MDISDKLRTAKLNQLRALVVEDDADNRAMLEKMLDRYNFTAVAIESGNDLKEQHLKRFDLILLDVMLPGKSGFEICKEIRQVNAECPILMVTARNSEEDVLKGYENGADDYLVKPVRMNELRERINLHLNKTGKARRPGFPKFEVADWTIEPESLVAVHSNGTVEHLSDREFELLTIFAKESGRIVSRRMLLKQVWGFPNPDNVATRTVDMHVAKLRKKFAGLNRLLRTIRGHGYRYDGQKLEISSPENDQDFQDQSEPKVANGY